MNIILDPRLGSPIESNIESAFSLMVFKICKHSSILGTELVKLLAMVPSKLKLKSTLGMEEVKRAVK
jgi:hypothetical protein